LSADGSIGILPRADSMSRLTRCVSIVSGNLWGRRPTADFTRFLVSLVFLSADIRFPDTPEAARRSPAEMYRSSRSASASTQARLENPLALRRPLMRLNISQRGNRCERAHRPACSPGVSFVVRPNKRIDKRHAPVWAATHNKIFIRSSGTTRANGRAPRSSPRLIRYFYRGVERAGNTRAGEATENDHRDPALHPNAIPRIPR